MPQTTPRKGCWRKAVRAVCFLCLFALLFVWFTDVLRDKTDVDIIRPYYDEPANSLDIVFVGSSHIMCGVYPMELYEASGYMSYAFTISAQTVPQMYYQTVAALETQHPQLIVLDMGELLFSGKTGDKAFVHRQTDNIRYSLNKVQLIVDLLEPEERIPNFLNLVLYHSRWKELTEEDFSVTMAVTKGTKVFFTAEEQTPPDVPPTTQTAPIASVTDAYLRRTIELCRSRGVEVLLLYIPSCLKTEEYEKIFSAAQYAEEYGIEFLNLMEYFDELGLDYASDFRDSYHLNAYGARKVTAFLASWLPEHYPLAQEHSAALIERWDRALEEYRAEYPK